MYIYILYIIYIYIPFLTLPCYFIKFINLSYNIVILFYHIYSYIWSFYLFLPLEWSSTTVFYWSTSLNTTNNLCLKSILDRYLTTWFKYYVQRTLLSVKCISIQWTILLLLFKILVLVLLVLLLCNTYGDSGVRPTNRHIHMCRHTPMTLQCIFRCRMWTAQRYSL